MLDQDLKMKIKEIFKDLKTHVELSVYRSEHAKQKELESMLFDVAAASPFITVKEREEHFAHPRFSLKKDSKETGIYFEGIPGGHEFSSLIIAIANVASIGKLPDEGILRRIKALKGKIDLRTYISLSCQNCPDVVQALNLMAIYHKDFTHTMVDGDFVVEEVERLGIQSVPSSMDGETLVHAGKTTLAALLEKLEARYGKEDGAENKDLGTFDVAVIGGGPAGVSSAIYAARKGLKTALIAENFGGQVAETKGIENLISVVYTEGKQLASQLSAHLAEYDVTVLNHRRVSKVKEGDLKSVLLTSGENLATKSLIVATGAKWRQLGVEGEKDYLGAGVAYCPHCDGPYYKGKDVIVVGGGNSGVEAAIDLSQIVRSVTLIEFADKLKADEVLVKKLQSLENVTYLTSAQITKIEGDGKKVTHVEVRHHETKETQKIDTSGVFVQIGLLPNSDFVKEVVETNKFGEIIIDEKGRTSQPGIYAAGDVTTVPYKQIIISMGEGAKAALAAFEDQMVA